MSDAGLKPATTYRLTLMGHPEEFCIRNSQGQPLVETSTHEFGTRPDSDPEYLEDQIPAVPPAVISTVPQHGDAGVTVQQGNEVVIGFSENLDPCSIDSATVRFSVYQTGDINLHGYMIPGGETYAGNDSGFQPWNDSEPGDPLDWGGNAFTLPVPQTIPSTLDLVQSIDATELRIRPNFGFFPENALCVVELTFNVLDFGGTSLPPQIISFTTENLPAQQGLMTVNFDTTTEPWPQGDRTADIDTARSPGLGQGWMLFAGDGDNGNTTSTPMHPLFPVGNPCADRANDGFKDHFDPVGNVTLNTGTSRVPSHCTNNTDGSTAVVWEFATFRIRNGVTVTVSGENPAILLVQGQVLIENGGILRARGGAGGNGSQYGSNLKGGSGGNGVVGGSDGGKGTVPSSSNPPSGNIYGGDGYAGYGSDDYDTPAEQGGLGAGSGNVAAKNTGWSSGATGPGGGGGGHGGAGNAGSSLTGGATTWVSATDGAGGGVYPTGASPEKMYMPSAGSGGGASAWMYGGTYYYYMYYYYVAPGAGAGAGGGFLDITSQADIRVYGEIDVSGGRGGRGGTGGYWAAGGGGGGSGGGVRLLTPADIDVTGGTINAAGGSGGAAGSPNWTTANPSNAGGAGGLGRICMEDGDSVITGIIDPGTNLSPGLGHEAFYVGEFQASRFQGGGLDCMAVSGPILLGPLSPATFIPPTKDDFLAAIPAASAIPPAGTAIVIEAAGYPMLPDGTVDLTVPELWYTIGYFAYSGAPNEPNWIEGANPADVAVSNAGTGINNLDGSGYLRFRLTFYLANTVGATTPGPWLDWMSFRFNFDQ
jgi:hypothetical protein